MPPPPRQTKSGSGSHRASPEAPFPPEPFPAFAHAPPPHDRPPSQDSCPATWENTRRAAHESALPHRSPDDSVRSPHPPHPAPRSPAAPASRPPHAASSAPACPATSTASSLPFAAPAHRLDAGPSPRIAYWAQQCCRPSRFQSKILPIPRPSRLPAPRSIPTTLPPAATDSWSARRTTHHSAPAPPGSALPPAPRPPRATAPPPSHPSPELDSDTAPPHTSSESRPYPANPSHPRESHAAVRDSVPPQSLHPPAVPVAAPTPSSP